MVTTASESSPCLNSSDPCVTLTSSRVNPQVEVNTVGSANSDSVDILLPCLYFSTQRITFAIIKERKQMEPASLILQP